MRRLRFLPEARQDLRDAIAYYADVRKQLAVDFESAARAAVYRALQYPDHGAARPKNTRRLLLKGFPFSLVYRATEGEVLIVAVSDSRRQPGYWLQRL